MTKTTKKRKGVIYKITFPNDKIYIGKTIRDVNDRFKKHISSAYIKTSHEYNTKMSRAIRKYGSDSLKLDIVISDIDEDQLDSVEIEMIKKFNSKKRGYNSTNGGSGVVGYKHSDAKKKKMSIIKKKQFKENPNIIARGEKCGSAKITWANVREIRKLYRDGDKYTQEYLGRKFNISRRAVRLILVNKNWYDPEYNGDISDFRKGGKLSQADADEIRRVFLTRQHTSSEIAKMFNISFQYVCSIVLNEHFKDAEFDKKLDIVKDIMKYNHGKSGRAKRFLSDNEELEVIKLLLSGKNTREIQEAITKKVSLDVIRKTIKKHGHTLTAVKLPK